MSENAYENGGGRGHDNDGQAVTPAQRFRVCVLPGNDRAGLEPLRRLGEFSAARVAVRCFRVLIHS